MRRERVDGHKFENEFRNTMEPHYYLQRLHTMNTGYAGLTQPADFILYGHAVYYLELKETSKDSFSLSSIEQLAEIEEFCDKRKRHVGVPLFYYVIVHFIEHETIKVIEADTVLALVNARKSLRPDSKIGFEFKSLKEFREKFIL